MVLGILSLAGVALFAGLVSLFGGLALISTDYGQTYFLAGAVLVGAGLVVLSIGLAAKAVLARLGDTVRALPAEAPTAPPAMPMPPAAPLPPAMPELPRAAERSASPETAPELPSTRSRFPLPGLGGIAAAGAAIGAAGAGASAALTPDTTGIRSIQDKLIEDFERDLFADPAETPAPSVPALQDPPAAAPMDTMAFPPALPDHLPPGSAEPPSIPVPELRIDMPDILLPELPPSVPAASEGLANEPPAAHKALDEAAAPPPAEPAPADPAPSGLIADEDLARIATSEPELAPLDTLDIVGAYDSGGTRFTMYSDGSVVAAGPQGDRRFPSLDALRRYIDQAGKA